jgi:hypothetical protein
MNREETNLLERLEATLKARRVAEMNALMAVVNDDTIEFQRIANAHNVALNHAVFVLADELNVINPKGGLVSGELSPLRKAAVDLIKKF